MVSYKQDLLYAYLTEDEGRCLLNPVGNTDHEKLFAESLAVNYTFRNNAFSYMAKGRLQLPRQIALRTIHPLMYVVLRF
jgi:hypothetical protein